METEPYSIYFRHRPFKIAFLVNPDLEIIWVDRIISYNSDKWGGKFNPIIFTDGMTIADKWWKFLRDYDPDIIFSTVALSEKLKKNICMFLSPLFVEEVNRGSTQISIDSRPISIFPTEKNISRVGVPNFDQKNNLILFEINEFTPDIIKIFLKRNFGLLGQNGGMSYHIKKALGSCSAKKYMVTDENSLNEALLDISDWNTRAVFPTQICSLPNLLKETVHTSKSEQFEIIVGDTIDEITYFWNRTMAMPVWLRTYFTQLWLPKKLAESECLMPGLGKFINHFSNSTGNTQSHAAHFVTLSLSKSKIHSIANSFEKLIRCPKRSNRFDQYPVLEFKSNSFPLFLQQGLNFHRAHSNEEYLVLDEPDVEQGCMGGENWFTDLYIQYRPELFKNIIGKDYWWQLPRRNSILHNLQFFNKPARINEHGMFSILMNRRIGIHAKTNTLVIKIPDDRSVFYALLCGESFDCLEKGDRERFLSRPFDSLQRSDKGMYLSGVLGLFPDLFNAHDLFEKRYWRNIFERMSNQNPEKDKTVQKRIIDALNNKLKHGVDLKKDVGIAWLAEQVFHNAKNYSKEEIDFNYTELSDLAKSEADEYNTKSPGSTIDFNENDFSEKLSYLVDIGVFLLGVKPKCHQCGYRIWYQVDDIKQKIICRGCGHENSLPAEPKWYYRLNSLIRVAVSLHGTVPVLITLGQVMMDARSAAMFMPSVELFKKGSKKPVGELDLVCIKDGHFIIGEIKQSVSRFHKDDFKKMGDIAKLVRPDVIIFSSMDKEPNKFVEKEIDKLRAELTHLEIKVEWYSINRFVFEASPIY